MKNLYIQDLQKGADLKEELFAVKSYKKTVSRSNKPYIDLDLADKTGSVKAKIWTENIKNCEEAQDGDVVKIDGTVEEFSGILQIVVSFLKKEKQFEAKDFLETTKKNIDKMFEELKKEITTVKNKFLKELLINVFADDDFRERFKKAPAGYRVHHAYLGGLLEHTLETIHFSKAFFAKYPKLNYDLLTCGLILHDVGKVFEYKISTTISFYPQGKLLGHIFLGAEFVKSKTPKGMPEDLLDEVLHLILSHHGTMEYGSPVKPMTPEAIAIHVVDFSSAQVFMAYKAIHGEGFTDVFTAFHRQLQTELYRSPYIQDFVEELESEN